MAQTSTKIATPNRSPIVGPSAAIGGPEPHPPLNLSRPAPLHVAPPSALTGLFARPGAVAPPNPLSGPGSGSGTTSSGPGPSPAPGPGGSLGGSTGSGPGPSPAPGPGGSAGSGSTSSGPLPGQGSTTGTTSLGGPSGVTSVTPDTGSTITATGVTPYDAQLTQSLLGLIQTATSPDALEAQNIILRRIALQGDVVASRVPPPQDITEIGGYINLLTTLQQGEMLSQLLAGILGVAGPTPPLGWLSNATAVGFATVANDRPAVAAQAAIPLTIAVRTDFLPAFQTALATLHNQGASLPLLSEPINLPTSAPGLLPATVDPMPYLGRTLDIVPATALANPATDPIALVYSSSAPFQLAAQVLSPGSVAVAAGNWTALQCTTSACTTVSLANAQFVPLAPILATAGFYPATPLPTPTSLSSTGWGHFTNVTGLVVGQTKLGDELSLLYSWSQIVESLFAGALNWVWNGTTFAPSSG